MHHDNHHHPESARMRSDVTHRSLIPTMSSPIGKPGFFAHEGELAKKYRGVPGHEHEEANLHRHMMQLETAMNYLMSENQFFKCLQLEVYLYFAAIFLFFVLSRQAIVESSGIYPRFWVPLQPILVLYIIFFIKYINKLRLGVDMHHSWNCLAVICCYLVFIVDCTSSDRCHDWREPEICRSHVPDWSLASGNRSL